MRHTIKHIEYAFNELRQTAAKQRCVADSLCASIQKSNGQLAAASKIKGKK